MNLLLWLFQTSNTVCFHKMIGGNELEGEVPREFGEYCLNLKMDDVENSLEIRSPMTVKKYGWIVLYQHQTNCSVFRYARILFFSSGSTSLGDIISSNLPRNGRNKSMLLPEMIHLKWLMWKKKFRISLRILWHIYEYCLFCGLILVTTTHNIPTTSR